MNCLKKKVSLLAAIIIAIGIILVVISARYFLHSVETGNSNTQINNIIYNDKFSLQLSAEEKAWIKNNPIIRLGIDRAFPPFGSITKNNKYIGFSADFMRIIEYRLGLKFAIAKNASWAKTMELAKTGQIDMISALVNTPQRQEFLYFTPPFSNNPTVIVKDINQEENIKSLKDLNGKTVAIEKDSYAANELKLNYPKIKLNLVKNTSTALSLVALNKADAYVGNLVTANYLIKELGYHNLSASGSTEFSSNHSIGIVKPNEILASAVTKALASINNSDRNEIANYWFGIDSQSFVSKNTAIAIASTLASILLFIVFWSFSLRNTKIELKESQKAMKAQSEIDYLTGLANRRRFYEYLNTQVTSFKTTGKPFTLFFLDLDMFKEVNDSLGHAFGDLLLVEAARRIKQCIYSDFGFVARIGGDEFMIILPGVADKTIINQAAECIRHRISDTFVIEDNEINITASIGVTRFPNDATNAEQLVINGDQAMYYSKKKGRNCCSYFSRAMQLEAQYKTNLIKDLRVAVEKNQFQLFYQPIIDLKTNSITKAEALIRWDHPERGFVSPVEFIPLAEEAGLINEIGEWTFKKAMEHTVIITNNFNENFQMTVNTSPLQYRQNGISVSSWCNYLDSCGLSGKNIVVEITEGILMETSKTVINNLFQLRDLNIGVAIDDFGTGYSSLSYLKKFDIDFLKIDQSFVSNLTHDDNDVALIQAIIVMAHQLGINVIAEGIETKAQMNILMEAGCDYGQGFYFSKPITANKFLALLANWKSTSPQDQVTKHHAALKTTKPIT